MVQLVSVIIPAYNAARWLPGTLGSVIEQTHQDMEIIVVNDGSTDRTACIVDDYARKDRRVHLLNQPNRERSAARNAGMRAAQGEYVAFLDADDLWLPSKLARQVACLEQRLECGACYTWAETIDDRGEIIESLADLSRIYWHNPVDALTLAGGNYVSGSASSVVMRRDLVKTVGFFDEAMQQAEDWDYWYRMALRSRFCLVPEALVRIRRHSGGKQTNIESLSCWRLHFVGKARHVAPRTHIGQLSQVELDSQYRLFLYYFRSRRLRLAAHRALLLLFSHPIGAAQRVATTFVAKFYLLRKQRH